MSYCIFFFFNHKTAYEMRISDCSSDVCSSDLEDGEHRRRTDRGKRERDEHLAAFQHAEFGEHVAAPGTREVGEREAKRRHGKKAPDRDDAERATPAERLADPRRERHADAIGESQPQARKRVVTGQRVSVRVNPGGGRSITK